MNYFRSSISVIVALVAGLTISGCGMGFVNSEATSPTNVTSPTPPQGPGMTVNNYGGHAPLAGAHIYMVQLGAPAAQVTAANSPQTYGSVVKSLLTTNGTYSGTYPLATNAGDQFVPSTDLVGLPFQYVTTDQYGQAFFTGDYACDPGYPVILIGYGGAPSFPGAGSNVFTVSNVTVSALTGTGATETATYTFITTKTQLFYTGESVTVTGLTGLGSVTSVTGKVLASGLTGTTFAITGLDPNGTATAGAHTTGGTATGTPTSNPAAANMAVLGNCPTTGVPNFGPTSTAALSFIWMNEVSTTAAAYALSGFTNSLATSQTGYDEFHLGAPVGNLTGIQNAAMTAGLLYDITGGSGTGTTPGNGESHVARTVTPNGANGVVPQQLINTIANALAACVDSNNTFRQNAGTYSTACLLLHQYATDNGVFDTTGQVGGSVPILTGANTTHWSFNIAQAAFNLARFPQGAGIGTTANPTTTNLAADGNTYYYGGTQAVTAGTATTASNFVAALVNLPAGANTPFGPNYTTASALNDLAIGINWSTAGANGGTARALGEIAADANGNLWIAESGGVYQLSPSGVYTTYTSKSGSSASGANPGLAIGTTGTVYESATAGFQSFTPGTTLGNAAVGSGGGGTDLSVDGSYVYQATSPQQGLSSLINKYSFAGVQPNGFPLQDVNILADTYSACAYDAGGVTPDQFGNAWSDTAGFLSAFGILNEICQLDSGGNTLLTYGFNFSSFGTNPHNLALDNGNNAWAADSGLGAVRKVTQTLGGTVSTILNTLTGTLSTPWGVAVDGANTTWVANAGNGSVTQYGNNAAAITPTNLQGGAGFNTAGGAAIHDLTNLAIDPSGNVWAAAIAEGYVVQYVGAGAPTTTPISLATVNRTNGVKAGLTSSPVTAYSITGNVVTFTGANSFYVGEKVSLGQFPVATYLNGQTITLTAVSGTTFKGAFTHANASATEAGLASAQN